MAKAAKKKKTKTKKEQPTKLNMSLDDALQMSFAPKIKKSK